MAFLLWEQNAGRDDDRIFVLHTRTPRFLMEFVPGSDGEFYEIDRPTADIGRLKADARDFFEGETEG